MSGTPSHVRIAVAVRRTKAMRLRATGKTWQQIADQLGYRSRGAACQDVGRAIAARNGARRVMSADTHDAAFRSTVDMIVRDAWAPIAESDPLHLLSARPQEFMRALALLAVARDAATWWR